MYRPELAPIVPWLPLAGGGGEGGEGAAASSAMLLSIGALPFDPLPWLDRAPCDGYRPPRRGHHVTVTNEWWFKT